MSETKQRAFLRNWNKTRRKGRSAYILKNSILWGVVTYFLYNGLKIIFGSDYHPNDLAKEFFQFSWWLKFLLVILVGGPLYSIFSWYLSERSYKKLLKELKESKEFIKELKS